jgi:DNA-binding transcriptional LysR family regulator
MTLLSKRGLSLERLQALLDVAEKGSLIAAAKQDPVRQSLISRQLRDLAEFFGTEMVSRQGRGVVLTPAGRRLATLVREQFKALGEFYADCEGQPVRLSLVSARTILNWVVIPRLQPDLVPGVSFDLIHERSADAANAVAESRCDLCIVDRLPMPRTLKRRSLGSMGYSLYLPAGLSAAGRISWREALAKMPLALPAAGRIREQLEPYLGTNAAQIAGVPGFDSALNLLRTGRYAAVLPDVAVPPAEAKSLRRLSLDPTGIKPREYFLVWSKRAEENRPPLARAVEILSQRIAF